MKPKESKERVRSEKIDRILTGKYTAIPCFIGIMVLVFYLTFNVIGAWMQSVLEYGIDQLSAVVDTALLNLDVNPAIHSLVIDGIFTGVGSVLSFLPIIVTLFFFLSLMEDSGYIARVAFVMDKLLRKIGLSGRSIVPMLIGFGCTENASGQAENGMQIAFIHQVAANFFSITIGKEHIVRQHYSGPGFAVGLQAAVDMLEEVQLFVAGGELIRR